MVFNFEAMNLSTFNAIAQKDIFNLDADGFFFFFFFCHLITMQQMNKNKTHSTFENKMMGHKMAGKQFWKKKKSRARTMRTWHGHIKVMNCENQFSIDDASE